MKKRWRREYKLASFLSSSSPCCTHRRAKVNYFLIFPLNCSLHWSKCYCAHWVLLSTRKRGEGEKERERKKESRAFDNQGAGTRSGGGCCCSQCQCLLTFSPSFSLVLPLVLCSKVASYSCSLQLLLWWLTCSMLLLLLVCLSS